MFRRRQNMPNLCEKFKAACYPFLMSKCVAFIDELDIIAVILCSVIKNVVYDCLSGYNQKREKALKKIAELIDKLREHDGKNVENDLQSEEKQEQIEEPPKKTPKLNSEIAKIAQRDTDSKQLRKKVVKKGEYKNGEAEIKAYLFTFKETIFVKQGDAERIVKDPGIWWKVNHEEFPYLGILYRAIMCISGSSCASESMFSIAKHLVEGIKNRTSPKKLNDRTFGQSMYRFKAKLEFNLVVKFETLANDRLDPLVID